MKEYKILEIYDTEMEITNQKVAVIELAEIEQIKLTEDSFVNTYGESKKFLIDLNSPMFPQILRLAQEEKYVSLDLKDFRIREENRRGGIEEIAYHKNVFLIGIDNQTDFNKSKRTE